MSINRVQLLGYVGTDPDVRYYQDNKFMVRLSMATNEPAYTAPNGTIVPERTEWHSVLAWGASAKYVERNVHKGTKLYVEGKLRTRSWDDEHGSRHYATEIYADYIDVMSVQSSSQNSVDTAKVYFPDIRETVPENSPSSVLSEENCPF